MDTVCYTTCWKLPNIYCDFFYQELKDLKKRETKEKFQLSPAVHQRTAETRSGFSNNACNQSIIKPPQATGVNFCLPSSHF